MEKPLIDAINFVKSSANITEQDSSIITQSGIWKGEGWESLEIDLF